MVATDRISCFDVILNNEVTKKGTVLTQMSKFWFDLTEDILPNHMISVDTKAWAAGWWEVSGGAAQAGESSYEAVLREVREETGLDVSGAEGGYVFTYKRENPGEGDNYFVDVYRFTMNIKEEDLHLQTEETDGYMFASKEQIEAFAKEGIFLHYDSIKQVFK